MGWRWAARAAMAVGVAALVAATTVSCGGGDDDTDERTATTAAPTTTGGSAPPAAPDAGARDGGGLEGSQAAAVARAAEFLRTELAASSNPLVLADAASSLDYVRRTGVAGFDWVANDLIPRALGEAGSADDEVVAAQIAVFARFFDGGADLDVAPATMAIPGGAGVAAEALWCDRWPPGKDLAARIDAAVAAGGYELTHAVLAPRLMAELGCDLPAGVDAAAPPAVISSLLALAAPPPTDLSLEACGILRYVAPDTPIPPEVLDAAVAGQNDDGGWSREPGGVSEVHATEWGVRCLSPAPSSVPWSPRRG